MRGMCGVSAAIVRQYDQAVRDPGRDVGRLRALRTLIIAMVQWHSKDRHRPRKLTAVRPLVLRDLIVAALYSAKHSDRTSSLAPPA